MDRNNNLKAQSLSLLLENTSRGFEDFINHIIHGFKDIYRFQSAGLLNITDYSCDLLAGADMHAYTNRDSLDNYRIFNLNDSELILVFRTDESRDEKFEDSYFDDFIKHFSKIINDKKNNVPAGKYFDFFEKSPALLYTIDIDGNITEINEALRKMLCFFPSRPGSDSEIIGMSYNSLLMPDDSNRMKIKFSGLFKSVVRYIKNEKEKRILSEWQIISNAKKMNLGMEPVTFVARDGSIFFGKIDATLLIDRKGRVTGAFCTAFDKTEQKLIEDALRISEEKYKTLFERSPAFSFLINSEGCIYEINEAGTGYGYSPEEGPIPYKEFLYGDVSAKAAKVLEKSYVKGVKLSREFDSERITYDESYRQKCYNILMEVSVKNLEVRVADREKTEVKDLLMSSNLLIDRENLGIKGILATAIDVTERKTIENKLRTVLESIGEAYYEVDLKGNMVFFSNAMSEMLGYSAEELNGLNYGEYTSEESAIDVFRIFNKVFRTGQTINTFDWKVVKKNGGVKHVETSTSLMTDSMGNKSGFMGIIRDVTQRKESEEKLIESQQKYMDLYKLLPVYSFLINKNSRIVDFNEKSVKIIGYTPVEGALETKDIIHPDDYASGKRFINFLYEQAEIIRKDWFSGVLSKDECLRKLRSLSISHEEIRLYIRKNVYYTNISASLWLDRENLDVLGILATGIDISEKKYLEQKALESELKYSEIVEEKTKDIIFSSDRRGYFQTANRNLQDKLGFSEYDVNDMKLTDILFDDPNDINNINRTTFIEKMEAVLFHSQSDVRFKAVCRHKALGEAITLQFKLDPVYENNEVTGMIGFVSEVSDDPLREFLDTIELTYNIDNRFTTADDVSFRLTRDLPKYFRKVDVSLVRMGLREMIFNAIEHGNLEITYQDKTTAQAKGSFTELLREKQTYMENREKKVFISYKLDSSQVRYTVIDQGTGFDYKKIFKQNPDNINSIFLEHGRGILASRNIFDVIEYNKDGNGVTLIKYVKK